MKEYSSIEPFISPNSSYLPSIQQWAEYTHMFYLDVIYNLLFRRQQIVFYKTH